MERYKVGNPFEGRKQNEVWNELLSKSVKTDRIIAMKQIEEIISKRKAQSKE